MFHSLTLRKGAVSEVSHAHAHRRNVCVPSPRAILILLLIRSPTSNLGQNGKQSDTEAMLCDQMYNARQKIKSAKRRRIIIIIIIKTLFQEDNIFGTSAILIYGPQ